MDARAAIRELLQADDRVSFALLFGSRATGRARHDSDWDVGVYLSDGLSNEERWQFRLQTIAALEPAIPVDLVILNDAPALLAHRALSGELFVLRDRTAHVRFYTRTLAAAGDERYWAELHAAARARRLEEGRFGRP
jgi:predicted nucleotidyltransferase